MTFSRAQAAAELAARSGRALIGVGLMAADTTGNLKEPLDDTFRALGTAHGSVASATVDDTALDRFLAVGAVFVLRRALDEAMGFADVAATTLGVSKRKSQIVKNLEDRLAAAEAQAATYGLTGVTSVMSAGVYLIDMIEPEDAA